jgi:hypothetical protein
MKKILALAVAALALLVAFIPAARAAVVSSDFNVSVTLTAVCTATNSNTQTVNFGTYTAFGSASTPAPTAGLTFNCTRGLAAPTVAFDTTNGTAIGGGVLAGLNYDLNVGAPVIAAGTPATSAPGGTGTADAYTYTVTGSMAAGQAGDCGGGTATACTPATASHVRQLIVTY